MRTRGGISSICQVLPSHLLGDDLMLLAISFTLLLNEIDVAERLLHSFFASESMPVTMFF